MAQVASSVLKRDTAKLYAFIPGIKPEINHYQKTIVNTVSCKGIGVHSGLPVHLTLHPSVSNSGITFVRTDLNNQEVKAHWKNVVDTHQCTTISNDKGVKVATVEHLMAALASIGIDNVCIEIDGPELPIMDGSAAPFVRMLYKAGVKEQRVPRHVIRVLKEVSVKEGNSHVTLSPSPQFEVEVDFDFAGRASIRKQSSIFKPFQEDFLSKIASARTFGFLEDAERMWALGLAKGASLDNTLVYDREKVVNQEGERFENECARHKVLDVIGDLHLAGGLILGKFYGLRTGHTMNHKLLIALFSDKTAWHIEEL